MAAYVGLDPQRDIDWITGQLARVDPEDSLRFYALWLHEFGEINSTPNKIIAEGTDWRFLNQFERELKA